MAKYQPTPERGFWDAHRLLWTDHTEDRWKERVVAPPAESELQPWPDPPEPLAAFTAGEYVDHPDVTRREESNHDRARVFVEADKDGVTTGRVVVFLVKKNRPNGEPPVIKTLVRGVQYDDAPTKAYLYAHGPHTVEK